VIVSDIAITKRVSVMVLAALILIAGLYCYLVLPRESTPDITIPHVFITTNYRGVSPPDIETSVTIPIEKKLTGLENVKQIKSVSAEGTSSIVIEFTSGTDIDKVLRKVKDKVDEAGPDLPTDLEEDPSVFEVNFSDLPIVVYSLSGDIEPVRLKKIADDLADQLETITGVLEVEVTGGRDREIKVEFIPARLAYFGISPAQIEAALRQENQNVSGGAMRMADGRFLLRTPGEMKTPEDFFRLVVGVVDQTPVYLADVARVSDNFKEEVSRTRLDGRPAINILVKKRAGENIIRIADQVDRIIAAQRAAWPSSTRITKLMDNAKDIRNMVADLENNLITGLLLVILVLPFALGFRNAVLVGLAIPFSMFLSFIVLYSLGITLNMVVLYSLTLALGMLVDNAIVIVENIYRFTSQGVPRIQAAMRATSEVAYPVIGSTLTTLVAFLPMIFWPGIMGEFMKYLPITLIITLSSSLFVALVINPALAAIFLKQGKPPAAADGVGQSAEQIMAAGEKPAEPRGPILLVYRRVLEAALSYRLPVLLGSLLILVLMVEFWMLRVGIDRPVEFFPAVDPVSAYVNFTMPEGADLELSDRIVKQVEIAISGHRPDPADPYIDPADYEQAMLLNEYPLADGRVTTSVSDLPNIHYLYATSASSALQSMDIFGGNTPSHVGMQFLDFNDRAQPSAATLEVVRRRLKDIPGAEITIKEADTGPPTGPPVNIEIAGPDFTVLGRLAKEIGKVAADNPFLTDIQDDFQEGTPTIRLSVDRQKAAMLGFSTTTLGQALKNAYNGLQVSTFHEGDEEFDITVQLPEAELLNTDTLRTLLIPSPAGDLVPLSTMARFTYTGSLGRIVRIDNERVVTVKANVNEAMIPAPVARAQVEQYLAKLVLPPGYRVRLTGEGEEQKESEDFLTKAFLVAVFLVTLVLVSQFDSVAQPLIIMSAVILSLGGAFLGLILYKMSFGIIMTGVGVISLAGVVVNNGIVLIDYTNQLRRRGMALREAVIAAGCTRLRPVLLTAITTILGLLPMVTGVSYDFHVMQISWASESSQWWRSMAVAVIFGLLVATLLTLVVVPAFYSLLESAKEESGNLGKRVHDWYWGLYDRIFGAS